MSDHQHDESCTHPGCQGPLDHNEVATIIAEHGQQVVAIFDNPQFCYTIGNADLDLPELLMVANADPQVVCEILNRLGSMQRERGEPLPLDEDIDIEFTFPLRLREASDEAKQRYTVQAGVHVGHEDYRVFQVVIPDTKGVFPGEPGCQPDWEQQPKA